MERAVALALALVLAGCGGAAGPTGPTATSTPAPVPSVEPSPTPVRTVGPGVATSGVRNVSALLAAHERALAGRSYVRVRRLHVAYPNGSTYFRQVSHTTVAGERSLVRSTRSGPHVDGFGPNMTVRYAVYNDGDSQVTRLVQRDGTVRTVRYAPATRVDARQVPVVARRLRLADHRVRQAPEGYLLVAADPDWDAFAVPAFVASPRAVRLRTLVTDAGFVRESVLSYRATLDGEPVRVRHQLRFERVGNASVAPPAWTATNATRTATPTG